MNNETKMTRRRFLAVAGGTVGVATLACGGLVAVGMREPEVEYVESSCGGDMENRILVAYASKCGSTGGVADAIGQVLCEQGAAVDVRHVRDVTDVTPYQALVVGSAVRAGRWLPEATKFVEAHATALDGRPVAYFAVCLTMVEDTDENRREASGYLDPVREVRQPVDVGLFAGALDSSKLNLPARLIMKAMKAEEGDFRNWEDIHGWAVNLHPLLVGA